MEDYIQQLAGDLPVEYTDGNEVDVAMFSAGYSEKTVQHDPKIKINKAILSNPKYNENLKFIIYHEIGHSKQDRLYELNNKLMIPLAIALIPHTTIDRFKFLLMKNPFAFPEKRFVFPSFLKTCKRRLLYPLIGGFFGSMYYNWQREFDADKFAFEKLETDSERKKALGFFYRPWYDSIGIYFHPPDFIRKYTLQKTFGIPGK